MKKQIRGAGEGSPKRGRKGARRCPCCGGSPCACAKTCFCQELKGEMTDDEDDAPRFEDDLHFSFLRHGQPAV